MASHEQSSSEAPESSERILVRGVNWLGDAVMTTPALTRLRAARPAAHITLLTHEKLADLWRGHPALNDLFTFSQDESAWKVAGKIRDGHFGTGVALPNSHRSALELWLGGVPRRVGVATPLRRLLLTEAVRRPQGYVKMRKRSVGEIRRAVALDGPGAGTQGDFPPTAHHLYHYLHLMAALGADPRPLAPQLHVTEDEVQAASRKFTGDVGGAKDSRELDTPPLWLGLNPGAEYGPAKRWPQQNFVAAARELSRLTGCRWLIFGGSKDALLAEKMVREIGSDARNLAGRTTLRELMALLRSCRALLSNDTGPMHLAAAVGTPVVALFGSTSPELTGPGLPGDPRHRLLTSHVPCSPCFLRECPIDFRCLNRIGVEPVVEAVRTMCVQNGQRK